MLQSITGCYGVLQSIREYKSSASTWTNFELVTWRAKAKAKQKSQHLRKNNKRKNPLYVPVTILYHMFYSDDINGGVATSKNITIASVLLKAGWIVNIREVLSPTIFNFRFIFLLLWLYLFHIFLPNCYVLLHPIYCFWVIFFNKRCFLFDFNG